MASFWSTLPRPFCVLAPMADVTDPAFRSLIADTAPPDVTWTEFVSADGLFHTREKKGMKDEENPLVRDLHFSERERPIVAQFFGSNPETMEYAAAYARSQGFDGVDINMGCPDKAIERQGAGAAHIKDPSRAKEVIAAALAGVRGEIPVSVKTRIGFNKVEYETWFPHLLTSGIATLSIHLRTRKEMSKVPAHYELAGEITSYARSINPNVVLIGNGDLVSVQEAREKALQHGFDGMMLGRAIFGNPWLFSGKALADVAPEERAQALRELARRFDALRPQKHFALLKKHFKAFIAGWDGAAELRASLMETNDRESFEERLRASGLVY